ncbi:VTT domain-containing protein [Endothiovibrio diazotrophicus]
MNDSEQTLLKPGENCWRREPAGRVALAVDGADYFRAVREAILRARRTVYLLGWDIHSRLRLVRDGEEDGDPLELGALLDFVAREHGVEVYVLSWDFAMIYLAEREPFPLYTLNWNTHPRVRFHMDDHHPVGASQHQKVVVVDDAVAFSGGLDLSQWRWDTSVHRVDDGRRKDPEGRPYPPFHDVQMAVDGAAAAALGELARERWRNATGETLAAPRVDAGRDPWPPSLEPVMREVKVAIARTVAEYDGRPEVREVERLYLESIAAAERFIYIENQYLTAHCIREALVERLCGEEGPEVVVVMPRETGGWLEQHTMDVLRHRLVSRLAEADAHGRLRIYYPRLAASPEVALMVHAKVMVVDDRLLRVGSSNLSNRSMGLDTECDLVIEAAGRETREAIAAFRNRLLAEHLGVDPAQVAGAFVECPSLFAVIDRLADGERTLRPLDPVVAPEVDQLVPESELLDPERPIDPERFVDHFVPDEHKPHALRGVLIGVAVLSGLLAMVVAWRWGGLGEWLDLDRLMRQAQALERYPGTPLWVVAAIGVASATGVPLTLLVVAAVLLFGALSGFLYGLAGALLGGVLAFAAGHLFGRDLVRRYAGRRLNRVSRKLSQRGLLTVVTLRVVPVAPYAVINLVAGASHIRFRDFLLGSLVGLLPGTLAIALFAEAAVRSLRDQQDGGIGWSIAALAALLFGGLWLFRRRLIRRRADGKGEA